MKFSNLFYQNKHLSLKEGDFINAMERGCYIKQLDAGFINYLSMGQLMMKKLKSSIELMMEKLEFSEIDTQIMQDLSLWKQTGKFQDYGDELFCFQEKNEKNRKDFCLGATGESLMTVLMKNFYDGREGNVNIYQITKKFRNEIRNKGLLFRAKEFYMKDAYSFGHQDIINQKYLEVKQAYLNFFADLGLEIYVKKADNGQIGGSFSEEFFVESCYGEEMIDGKKMLEIAHIFQIGTTYSEKLNFVNKEKNFVSLNSYGIGITRLLGVLLEKSFNGKRFYNKDFSVFDLHLIVLGTEQKLLDLSSKIVTLSKLSNHQFLVDDRNIDTKNKLLDIKLILTKKVLIVSEKNCRDGVVEVQMGDNISQVKIEELEQYFLGM